MQELITYLKFHIIKSINQLDVIQWEVFYYKNIIA